MAVLKQTNQEKGQLSNTMDIIRHSEQEERLQEVSRANDIYAHRQQHQVHRNVIDAMILTAMAAHYTRFKQVRNSELI
jgi:hypothetical protein